MKTKDMLLLEKTTNKRQIVKYLVYFTCLILFVASFLLPCIFSNKASEPIYIETIKSDTIYIVDTIRIVETQIVKETVIKWQTDTLILHGTDNDSTVVDIPISQKVYEGDNYEAYVSGYKPNLDSLNLFIPKETITNTVYVPKIEYKRPKWGVGIQVGYGTDFGRFSPYIGVGIQYNIFSW
ncbi:hypothetical protein D0T49_03965 [Paludibacter sp. 221]|uniref:DUF6808 domain-containing protein n=1 Tax=Paludibacter sp. 221 TaxID=2302939 RepID=UPI0013D20A63|nr:hypothetical protein [Paludibacter sp. 221]NDV46197.1 hypothetical protein [Paludibacter sp. 221]